MSKALRNDYLLVALTVISLLAGLAARFSNLATLSFLSFAIGAAIGLALSLALLVSAIRNGEFGSDVLALISIVATALTNEWLAASVIAVMLSGGRALESWAEGRARGQLEALLARAPHSAHLISEAGEIREVQLADVSIGDRLLVRNGEVVPIDGSLATEGTFDESALTGEPLPVYRSTGDDVNSGVLNSGAQVEIIARNTAENSTYSNLVRLVAQA
jgi:cation transport ATPase